MRGGQIVDAHLHLWDPSLLRYPWLNGNSLLNRAYLPRDFDAATRDTPVTRAVFVQCEAEPADALREATWVSGLAEQEPRIAGIVAWAPLEKGDAARRDLETLLELPLVRGIRRIIQFESDMDFCLQPGFIAGVRLLRNYGLSFDICTDWTRLPNVIRFAQAVPDVPMVLDHLGKPPVATQALEPWATHLRELARLPNVWCKISGVATEADHDCWTEAQLAAYIRIAIDAFGFERVMFGGDWPVSLQAVEYSRWVSVLDDLLASVSAVERERFWSSNATRFYRLQS